MLLEYPAEKELHYRLLEIFLGRLGDQEHAAHVMARAMENLPKEQDRQLMLGLQTEILSGSYHPGGIIQAPLANDLIPGDYSAWLERSRNAAPRFSSGA